MSETVYISKINESYVRINGSYGVLQELAEKFTFEVPGARHMPQFKARIWDGKIRLFSVRERSLYLGLHSYVKQYCDQEGYECIYTDPLDVEDAFSVQEADELIKGLSLSTMVGEQRIPVEVYDYQKRAIIHSIQAKRSLLVSPTACHSPGTRVVMFDGSLKSVEDVKVGDLLMGPDSKPREVLRLFHGEDNMYRISPIGKGMSFEVTENHILPLIHTNTGKKKTYKASEGFKCTVRVADYLKQSNNWKHLRKLYRTKDPIEFEVPERTPDMPIPPYFLGILLGDGSIGVGNPAITTIDKEIIDEICKYADLFDCDIRIATQKTTEANTYFFRGRIGTKTNWIRYALSSIGLYGISCGEKHIPFAYKVSSVKDRLELLAGLIDTDGYFANKSFYEFSSKSPLLASDVEFIARSLGFYCYKKEKIVNGVTYYRVNICGDIENIPVRIPRKRAVTRKKERRKDLSRFGFSVTPLGLGEYFGFQLSGDSLYLLEDFTVQHNSGKTMVMYALLRHYINNVKGKILLMFPSVSLVTQSYDDFKDYSTNDLNWNVEDYCHQIYQGKSKTTDKRVVVSTWQSLMRMPDEFFEQFDVVINDETHMAASKEISGILAKCVNASYRHGLTGTLKDSKTSQMVLEGLFGPVYQTTTTKALIEDKKAAELTIRCIQLEYPPEERKEMKKALYPNEIEFLITHEARNKFITNLALSLKGNVLVLYQFVEKHGVVLDRMIREKDKSGRKVFFVSGDTDVDLRTEIKKIVEKETDAIIVASFGVFSTGVSIRNLDYIILSSPSKARIRLLQSIGRGLRISNRKSKVTVFDVADDLRTYTKQGNVTWENYSIKHFLERIGIYNEQEFNYLLHKVALVSKKSPF